MTPFIEEGRKIIAEARNVCVLTGAGISAESGLKTFRDGGGLWENHRIEDVATPEGFQRDPELVWRFYNARRKTAEVATPNAAHIALARLELALIQRSKRKPPASNGHSNGHHPVKQSPFTVLTQNIDGLHQQAGSQNVVELHGSIWTVRCTRCEAITTEHPIELPILPHCVDCQGLLRPAVVWFGEMLDPDVLEQADAAIDACDVLLVIGTSGVVQPAALYPMVAARKKKHVIEINAETTPVSKVAKLSLIGQAGTILPQLLTV